MEIENEIVRNDMLRNSEQIAEEVEMRMSKRNNIIITGIPEQTTGTVGERKMKDEDVVDELADELGITDYKIQDTFRIGKNLRQPRLLRVTFADVSTKWTFIRKSKRLRDSENFKRCFIKPDFTFHERERNKKLREELQQKRKDGKDWIIRNGMIYLRDNQPRHLNFH